MADGATCGHCVCEWICEDSAKRRGYNCDPNNPFIPDPNARTAPHHAHLALTTHGCNEMRMDMLMRTAEALEQPTVCVVIPDDCADIVESKTVKVVVESALRKPEDYVELLRQHRVLLVPGSVGRANGMALTGARGGKLWVYTNGVAKPEWFHSVYLVRLVAWAVPDDAADTDTADTDDADTDDDGSTEAEEATDDDETKDDDNPRPAKRVRFASPVVASVHPK
jgi:hypothetical protein